MSGPMIRLPLIALCLALAAPLTACKKEKKPADQGMAATDKGEEKSDWPQPSGEAPPKTDEGEGDKKALPEPRPPTAEDLATYTSDLEGEGPLTATLETSKGTISCELFEKEAPMTVANFVGLARGMHPYKNPESGEVSDKPYYDGTVFHRVIPEFMIQGGDPTATGTGDPGYQFDTEVSPDLKHEPGTLSMANAGPNTNGGQFFITETATKQLDGKYNVFGRCKNVDVVKKIARVETKMQEGGGEKSRPVEEIQLVKVTISRGEGGAKKGGDDKKDDAKKDAKKDAKGDTKDAGAK
jgi:peptidyl-prolyl cis-trans isomerase A (cyclophilin A)